MNDNKLSLLEFLLGNSAAMNIAYLYTGDDVGKFRLFKAVYSQRCDIEEIEERTTHIVEKCKLLEPEMA